MKIVSNGIEATVEQYTNLMTGLAKPSPINNGLFDASILTEAHVLGDLYRWVGFKNPLTVRSADAESDPITAIMIQSGLPTRPSVGAALPDVLQDEVCYMTCGGKTVNWRTLATFLDGWRFNGAATETLIPVDSAEEVMPELHATVDSAYCTGWAIKLKKPLKLMCSGLVIRSIDRIFVVTADKTVDDPAWRELDSDYIIGECLAYHIHYLRGFSPTANFPESITDCFGGRKAKDQLWYGPNTVRMLTEIFFNTEIVCELELDRALRKSEKLEEQFLNSPTAQQLAIGEFLRGIFCLNQD